MPLCRYGAVALAARMPLPRRALSHAVPRRNDLAAYTTEKIEAKYHDALVSWQKKNFPELQFLEENWTKYYAAQTPFQLTAKIGKLNSETINYGRMAGQQRFENA